LAQAAATLEAMYPGRFALGLGSGEALYEQIVGDYWPAAPTRLGRLVEAIDTSQKLFTGYLIKHRAKHFTVRSARIFTHPAAPPPVDVATSGPIMAGRTGKLVDGINAVGAADE